METPLVQKLKAKGDLDCFLDPRAQIRQLEKWSLRYQTAMVVFALLAGTFVYRNRFRGLIISLLGGGIFQRLYSHQKGQIPKWQRRRDFLEHAEDWSPNGRMAQLLGEMRTWLTEIGSGQKRTAPGRIECSWCCCCRDWYVEATSPVPERVRNLTRGSEWAGQCLGFSQLFLPLSEQGLRTIHEALNKSNEADLALRVQYYTAALLEQTDDLFQAANDLLRNEGQSRAWHRFYLEKCDAAHLLGLYLDEVDESRWETLPEREELLPWSSIATKKRSSNRNEQLEGETAERWVGAVFKTTLRGIAKNNFVWPHSDQEQKDSPQIRRLRLRSNSTGQISK